MKINNTRSKKSSSFAASGRIRAQGARKGQVSFAENLHNAHLERAKQDLELLIPQLDEAAHALIESRTLRNLQRYRELVKNFLDKVIRESHQVKEISGFSGGRHKVMVVVEKVNEALEKLGQEVINNHAGSVHLLEIVDEIRGLLLDMYT
ncbi:MAG: YaaR family protein [Firmicutes bacterium]|nr:YaaR family protein [Bacillota bacterium]